MHGNLVTELTQSRGTVGGTYSLLKELAGNSLVKQHSHGMFLPKSPFEHVYQLFFSSTCLW